MSKTILNYREGINLSSPLNSYIIPIIILAGILGVGTGLTAILIPKYLLAVGFVSVVTLPSLSANFYLVSQRRNFWEQVAHQTQLAMQNGASWLGSSAYVGGLYRERPTTLYHSGFGHYQVQATRIEVKIENIGGESLRVRGPISKAEISEDDQIAYDMFSASGHQPLGRNQRYFARGPLYLTTALLTALNTSDNFARLVRPLNIELRGNTLYCDHPDIIFDIEYLELLLELVSDVADMIELKSTARQMLLTRGQ